MDTTIPTTLQTELENLNLDAQTLRKVKKAVLHSIRVQNIVTAMKEEKKVHIFVSHEALLEAAKIIKFKGKLFIKGTKGEFWTFEYNNGELSNYKYNINK